MPRLKSKMSALLLAAAFLPACSDTFSSKWQDNRPVVNADAAQTIEGKWTGKWYSNGYSYFNGICRAVVTPESTTLNLPTDPPGKRYRVEMQQLVTNVFPHNFTLILFLSPGQEGKSRLQGEKDFGPFSDGLYKFEGDSEGRSMYLSFVSINDYGTIVLRRFPSGDE
jgi:hypothetical protein